MEDEEDNLSAEERKQLEEPFSAFFAFPLTTRKAQPPPYSGRDPEWAAFVTISKDQALQSSIRHALASVVRKAAESSLPLTMKVGKDMKVRRYWFDVDYPYHPPPEYRRSGILVTDDAIEWTSRPVDPKIVNVTNRVLWPSPLFLSTWAFAGTLFKQNLLELSKAFGYTSRTGPVLPGTSPASQGSPVNPGNASTLPPAHDPDIQKALQRIRQQATKRPEEVKDPRAMASQNTDTPAYGTTSPSDPSPSAASPLPSGTAPGADKAGKRSDIFVLGKNSHDNKSSEPWQAFRRTFAQMWRPVREQPPRGCVCVSGLVELETSKSYVVIDVFAWWDPKTKQYDPTSMWMRLRRLQMKNQAPLRM